MVRFVCAAWAPRKLLSTALLSLTAASLVMAASSRRSATTIRPKEPSVVKIDAEKAKQWLDNGAQPTDTVREILKKAAVL